MTEEFTEEIMRSDLIHVFFPRNVNNIHPDGDDICYDVDEYEPDTDPERRVGGGDIEEVRRFLNCSLQTRPYANQLLQLLWIREVKLEMGALRRSEMFDFLLPAFELYGLLLDEEILEYEFFELLGDDYLREDDSEFSLTSEGRRFGEAMFETMKTLISPHVESQSSSGISTVVSEKKKPKQIRRTYVERIDAIREAVKYYGENEWRNITQREVEKKFGIGQGALSKGYGKELLEKYQKVSCRKESVSKEVGDDFVYNEKSLKQ